MLRLIFVLGIIFGGAIYAVRGPFNSLLFYIWYAYFRPESWVWDMHGELISSLRVSYLTGIFTLVCALATRQTAKMSLHLTLVIWFAFHALVSALLSKHSDYCMSYWVDFLKTVTIAYLIVALATTPERLRTVLVVMAVSLGFEGAKQGWLELIRNPGASNANSNPFLGDNNGVAVGMLMLVPVFAALAKTARKKWAAHFYRFMLLGVLYRAITTYSRGGFLALGALGILYWFRSRNKFMLALTLVVLVCAIAPVMPNEFWDRMRTIQNYQQVEDASALSRLHFWGVATAMAVANPVFGVGFNGYNPSYDEYDFSGGEYGSQRSVHSTWFAVLAEQGIVGFALYVTIILLAVYNCIQSRRKMRRKGATKDDALTRFAVSIESALAVFIVGGTFLPFQYNEMLWHFIGISMVLRQLTAQAAEDPSSSPRDAAAASGAGAKHEFAHAGP